MVYRHHGVQTPWCLYTSLLDQFIHSALLESWVSLKLTLLKLAD